MTGEAANVGIDNTASFIDRSSNSQGEHGSHGLPHEAGGKRVHCARTAVCQP